ncbi:MAG TPA: winged helix-turn-helix domain-containing protein [Candidatus Acidoferrum sp.]|jgi:DNA-binding winged helix-turn-helix (wHTH) protein
MNVGFTWKQSQANGQEIERLNGNQIPVNGLPVPLGGNGASLPLSTVAARQKTSIAARYVSFGEFEMDLREHRLTRGSQPIKIQGKVYQALLVLVESPGELVTREQLRNRLWPCDAHLNYDANVNTTVNKLRQLLGDTSESAIFIQTIPRRGYCFIAKVSYADTPAMVGATQKTEPRRESLFIRGGFLRSERARIWFTASVVTWVAAAVLFASAIFVYAHYAGHAPAAAVRSAPQTVQTP